MYPSLLEFSNYIMDSQNWSKIWKLFPYKEIFGPKFYILRCFWSLLINYQILTSWDTLWSTPKSKCRSSECIYKYSHKDEREAGENLQGKCQESVFCGPCRSSESVPVKHIPNGMIYDIPEKSK